MILHLIHSLAVETPPVPAGGFDFAVLIAGAVVLGVISST